MNQFLTISAFTSTKTGEFNSLSKNKQIETTTREKNILARKKL
tara:strand:- start:177 stop:305 length:129 start_codon:yes stop_codon:yes gene_type:complete